jgi:hypothetical protein
MDKLSDQHHRMVEEEIRVLQLLKNGLLFEGTMGSA